MNRRGMIVAFISCSAVLFAAAAPPSAGEAAARKRDQAALKAYGSLVGSWRGVGMVERNSRKGAWTESAEWVWKLDKNSASLALKIDRGKYLKSAILSRGDKPGVFRVEATLADDSKRTFEGKVGDRDKLVLVATEKPAEGVGRITLSPLHETRFLLLLETPVPDSESYRRLGEVGYTRNGVAFAAGDSYPKCVVTEGRGTIKVTYKGETYYVCCSGCKDLFDENPAAIIAEAKEREKNKK
jgi:YHS domain-containing protein